MKLIEFPLSIDTVDLCLSLVREERQSEHRTKTDLDRAERELKEVRELYQRDGTNQ